MLRFYISVDIFVVVKCGVIVVLLLYIFSMFCVCWWYFLFCGVFRWWVRKGWKGISNCIYNSVGSVIFKKYMVSI